ncbi:diacylglycerol kinase family protein [Thermoflexibacter ruber]|uniref:Undecaprenol kinase n=1 Tax=Thermoflexibacter ruber TaxID=1003 RepID=A0A1I2H274_9BACT|nr:diacylglycerol kinase family protein [Thermoflexibacter ruber]SFF23077.1 undecaprenol kinase [Thermoflexibacter ruber]
MSFLFKYGINLLKMLGSFIFAWRGIRITVKEENNMKVHAVAAVLVVGVAFFFQISMTDWAILLLVIGMVWTAEIFNSAFERLVDMVSPDFNPKAGIIKDMAAGAVLVSAIVAVVVGVLIFWKYVAAWVTSW